MLALILLWTRHTKTFFKNILTRNIKTTCVGNVGFDGFKPTITTETTY